MKLILQIFLIFFIISKVVGLKCFLKSRDGVQACKNQTHSHDYSGAKKFGACMKEITPEKMECPDPTMDLCYISTFYLSKTNSGDQSLEILDYGCDISENFQVFCVNGHIQPVKGFQVSPYLENPDVQLEWTCSSCTTNECNAPENSEIVRGHSEIPPRHTATPPRNLAGLKCYVSPPESNKVCERDLETADYSVAKEILACFNKFKPKIETCPLSEMDMCFTATAHLSKSNSRTESIQASTHGCGNSKIFREFCKNGHIQSGKNVFFPNLGDKKDVDVEITCSSCTTNACNTPRNSAIPPRNSATSGAPAGRSKNCTSNIVYITFIIFMSLALF